MGRFSIAAAFGLAALSACGSVPEPRDALPFADAGPDQVARVGALVVLDGRGSQDPNGGALEFLWKQVAGPTVPFSDSAAAQPTFTATLDGFYEFEVVATGEASSSPPDVVTVVVIDDQASIPRRPPAAEPRAGALLRVGFLDVPPGTSSVTPPTVLLADGTARVVTVIDLASDPTDDPSPGAIAGMLRIDVVVAHVPFSSLYCPLVAGDDDPVTLLLPDGSSTSVVSYGVVGQAFFLDGTRSHDDGVVRTFTWTQIEGPFRWTTEDPSLQVVPQTAGTYVFDLVVTDDIGLSSFARRVVIPVVPANLPGVGPPEAQALPLSGTDFRPAGGSSLVGRSRQAVSLDGSFSHPRPGAGLRFAWRQVSGPTVPIEGSLTPFPSFVPDVPGAYVFELTVTDDNGVSDAAVVEISVAPTGGTAPVAVLAPVADPVLPGPGAPPLVVALDGTSSEGDGVLAFRWTQVRGPASVVEPSPALGVGLVTIDQAGAYEFELRVFDGVAHSPPARVSFVVR